MWLEVPNLPDAEALMSKIQSVTAEASEPFAVRDEGSGALSRADLVPDDDPARAALAASDLGPGISSFGFQSRS